MMRHRGTVGPARRIGIMIAVVRLALRERLTTDCSENDWNLYDLPNRLPDR